MPSEILLLRDVQQGLVKYLLSFEIETEKKKTWKILPDLLTQSPSPFLPLVPEITIPFTTYLGVNVSRHNANSGYLDESMF